MLWFQCPDVDAKESLLHIGWDHHFENHPSLKMDQMVLFPQNQILGANERLLPP